MTRSCKDSGPIIGLVVYTKDSEREMKLGSGNFLDRHNYSLSRHSLKYRGGLAGILLLDGIIHTSTWPPRALVNMTSSSSSSSSSAEA